MTIIAPKAFGGYECGAFFIDCECTFPVRRLYSILFNAYQRLSQNEQYTEEEIRVYHLFFTLRPLPYFVQTHVHESMKRVFVIQPQSSLMLLNTIRTVLPELLSSSSQNRIRTVFIDSISSGIWTDQTSSMELKNGSDALAELLSRCNESGLVVFGTRRKFINPSRGFPSVFLFFTLSLLSLHSTITMGSKCELSSCSLTC